MDGSKFCPDCGEHRPAAEFTRDRSRQGGLAFYCREHARRRVRESRLRRLGPPSRRFGVDRVIPDGHKWCPDCDEVKPLSEFARSRATVSGIYSYCKPCHSIRGKASKDKVGGSRTYHLKRRYGITAEEADAMFQAQGGACAICKAAPAAHVDHDHLTGAVRALLCFNCNGGLGQFKDDPAVLRVAAEYVERHRAGSAPASGGEGLGRPPGTASRRQRHGPARPRHSPGYARWLAMQSSSPND